MITGKLPTAKSLDVFNALAGHDFHYIAGSNGVWIGSNPHLIPDHFILYNENTGERALVAFQSFSCAGCGKGEEESYQKNSYYWICSNI